MNHFRVFFKFERSNCLNVGIGSWRRSLMVNNKLKDREDLLQQIYPDLKGLDDYITKNSFVWDTIAAQTIIRNSQKDNGLDVDSLMALLPRRYLLAYEYFKMPLLR